MGYGKKVFFLQSRYNCPATIECWTLAEFLREFASDEITSPRGVEPRLFIHEVTRFITEIDEEGDEILTNETESIFQLRRWNPNGSTNLINEFESELDAEEERLDYWHNFYINEGTNPIYYDSEIALVNDLRDAKGRKPLTEAEYTSIQTRLQKMKENQINNAK